MAFDRNRFIDNRPLQCDSPYWGIEDPPVVIAGIVAVAVSLLAAGSQIKEIRKRFEYEQLAEKQRDREKKRIQYLDPLVISGNDLLAKINQLRHDLINKGEFWKGTLAEAKDRDRNNKKEFCTKIIDPWEHIWFIRLLDFYRDIHMKRDAEFPRMYRPWSS